jgi:outer membrane cobalamin receptor
MFRTTLLLAVMLAASPATAAEYEFGGTLEFEYADTRTRVAGVTDDQNNAYLATLELASGIQFNPNWRADLVLLAEDIENTDPAEFRPLIHETSDRPDELHVEELVLSYSRDNYSLSAGRYTLPFGNFETAVLSDPQTLEAGETKTSLGATFHQELGDISWHLSLFNGNLRDSSDDEDGFVLGAEWQLNDAWRVGGGYISAQGAGKNAPRLYDLFVAGEIGNWTLGAEFVGAAGEHNGEKPQTWSLDAAYAINDQWTVGGRWQQTDRFGVLDSGDGNYEELAMAAHYAMFDNVNVGLEYADGDEGSSDYELWLLQVAVSF